MQILCSTVLISNSICKIFLNENQDRTLNMYFLRLCHKKQQKVEVNRKNKSNPDVSPKNLVPKVPTRRYTENNVCFDLCALKAALAPCLELLFFPLRKWRIFPTRGPLPSKVSS